MNIIEDIAKIFENIFGARIKGKMGELFIKGKLNRLDPIHYKVLNDVLLPSMGNTPTTQIDHIVISNYGIFCIETKDYAGWIFGSANQEKWTQVLYRSKFYFFNPIRQNYAHIKAIEALVKPQFPSVPVYSYIAFPAANKLRISGADYVGNGRDMINKIESMTQLIVSDVERDQIYGILSKSNIIDVEIRRQHIKDAKMMKEFNARGLK